MTDSDPLPADEGRRALFEAPVSEPDAHRGAGRATFYSVRPDQEGIVRIDCSSCHLTTRTSMAEAGIRVLSLTLWFPWRDHSRWITCPACNQRSWCRVRWLG